MCGGATYSFKINGRIHGKVTSSRGLRQGDPISPYLFILVAEALSCLLSQAVSTNRIHGAHACRGGPEVSHLFFA